MKYKIYLFLSSSPAIPINLGWCSRSTFGCCPDDYTPAKGPKKGCRGVNPFWSMKSSQRDKGN